MAARVSSIAPLFVNKYLVSMKLQLILLIKNTEACRKEKISLNFCIRPQY